MFIPVQFLNCLYAGTNLYVRIYISQYINIISYHINSYFDHIGSLDFSFRHAAAIKKLAQQQTRWEREQQDPTMRVVSTAQKTWDASGRPLVVAVKVFEGSQSFGTKKCSASVRWNQLRGFLREAKGVTTLEIEVRLPIAAGAAVVADIAHHTGIGAGAGGMGGQTQWIRVDGPRHFEEAKAFAVEHTPPGGADPPLFDVRIVNPSEDDLSQLTDLPKKHKFQELAQKFYAAQSADGRSVIDPAGINKMWVQLFLGTAFFLFRGDHLLACASSFFVFVD